MVRSHLDYCSSVWSPYMKRTLRLWKRYKKRATKLKHMNYSDRLKACKLPTFFFFQVTTQLQYIELLKTPSR